MHTLPVFFTCILSVFNFFTLARDLLVRGAKEEGTRATATHRAAMRVQLAPAALALALAVTLAQSPLRGTGGCDPSKWQLPVDGVYHTKGAVDSHKLNVHLIAHSHDDPCVQKLGDVMYIRKKKVVSDLATVMS